MNKVLLGAALTVAGVSMFAIPAHANTQYDWFHCGTPEAESDCPTTTTYAVPTTVVTTPTTVTTEPTTTTEPQCEEDQCDTIPPTTVPIPSNLNPCISEPQLCPTTVPVTSPTVPSTLPVQTPTTQPLSPTSTTQPLSNVPTTVSSVTVPPVTSIAPSVPTTIPNNLPQTGANYDGITLLGLSLGLGGIGLIIAEKRVGRV